MATNHSLVKFRPVLTLEQIQYITALCSAANDPTDMYEHRMKQDIRKILVPMIAKVEVGAISPAYKLSETHAQKQLESAKRIAYESGNMTPEEEAEYEIQILGM